MFTNTHTLYWTTTYLVLENVVQRYDVRVTLALAQWRQLVHRPQFPSEDDAQIDYKLRHELLSMDIGRNRSLKSFQSTPR